MTKHFTPEGKLTDAGRVAAEEARHTLLPWHWSEKKEGLYKIYGCGAIIATVETLIDREQVSPNTFKEKIAEGEANAAFIRKAVNCHEELLEALELLVLEIGHESTQRFDRIKMAHATIIKARRE